MNDEPVVSNKRVNRFILRCLARINEIDAGRFRRKLARSELDAELQHHTIHELVMGAYLASLGFSVRSEVKHCGSTPDWSIFSPGGSLAAILEVATFHIDRRTSNYIGSQLATGAAAGYFIPDSYSRLYSVLRDKAAKYQALASSANVPYLVAIFISFELELSHDELNLCLFGEDEPVFQTHADLSGIVIFDEMGGNYSFQFIGNPGALRPLVIPTGKFVG